MDKPFPKQSSNSSALGLLPHRNFMLLWIGQAVSTFGDKFTEIAIPVLIYQVTHSPLQLGMAFLVEMISSIALGLIGGAVSDRWNRKKIMVFADILRCLLVISVPVLANTSLSTSVKLIILYGLIFILSSVRHFFVPAKMSVIPETIPQDLLVAANSADQASMKIMEFAGYSAAGLLIQMAGVSQAFAVDAASFLISAVLVSLMTITASPKTDEEQETIIADIRSGLILIKNTPILLRTVMVSFFAPMALGAVTPLFLVFSDRTLSAGASGYAAIQASIGLGLALGVVLIARYASKISRYLLLAIGVTGMGIALILAFVSPYLIQPVSLTMSTVRIGTVLFFIFLSAIANGSIFLALRVIVQENTPRSSIGRVFSVISVASQAAMSVGAATAGFADIWDVRLVLIGWAIFLVIIGVLTLNIKKPVPVTVGEGM